MQKLNESMTGRKCSFNTNLIQTEDVLKIVRSLKNSSASGIDYIDSRTLKLVADCVAIPPTHVIILSISSGVFPNIWKFAKVVPLLKSNSADATLPKSYRPMVLLPIMSKILEKAVFSQIIEYLEANKLIHPNLHGSRAGHDTSTALLQ